MARIVFFRGVDPRNLPPTRRVRLVDQEAAAKRLVELRAEWLEATGGDLSNVTVDLRALLDDVANIVAGQR